MSTLAEKELQGCSTCGSTAPHMHPAMQHGGEVEICTNDFHLRITPQNTFDLIDAVYAKRLAKRGGR
jgi:hypothetical protein